MLQKFLFVGLGGSGGKTLRFLYEDLQRRLAAVGWHGELPAGWQFLHIDVPLLADGLSPDLPPQLSRRAYVGLADKGVTYMDLDRRLEKMGPAVEDYAAPWRPRADLVHVDPQIGAGQYRAVGRIILAAMLDVVVRRIQEAKSAIEDAAADEDLSRAALLLTGDASVSEQKPQVVLVSSIAGGSGASILLDVADLIRHLADPWGDKSAAFLYLPDVFAEVPVAQRAGVTANALACVSELMNAYWADNTIENQVPLALLTHNGVTPEAGSRRGPRYPFLVGRTNNGGVRYATQSDVYRAVAKSLASWISNPHVQDRMAVSVLGNWENTARREVDLSRLSDGQGKEVPFSGMGYASVGLGRERFALYAAQRLTAHAVDHILRGHVNEDVNAERLHPTEAAAQRAAVVRHQFVDEAGLKELGHKDNQIIDALRGGEGQASRQQQLQILRADLLEQVAGTGAHEIEAHQALTRVLTRYRDSEPAIVGRIHEDDAARARVWFEDVQERIMRSASRLLGQEGALVTEMVISETAEELRNSVVPELRHEAQAAFGYASQHEERVRGKFAGLSGHIRPTDNPAVLQALDECSNSAYAQAEARLLQLAAALAADLADNLLGPLLEALKQAREGLAVEDQGTPEQPSVVKRWSRGTVPTYLRPAQNEVTLEDIDDYPAVFLSRVRATVDVRDELGAQALAVRQVISGENPLDEDKPPTVIRQERMWIPREQSLNLTRPPARASFRVSLTVEQMFERADAWVRTPGTAIATHIGESLRHWLEPENEDARTSSERLTRFATGLAQARRASAPLLELDAGRESLVHRNILSAGHAASEVVTPFPFPEGHPGRKVVRETFHGASEDQLAAMFDDKDVADIEFTTFLSAPVQPMVIRSLYEPIKADWIQRNRQPNQGKFWDRRRTRPLVEFVPAPPETLMAWLRGWHVARLLDWVQVGDQNREPVRLWTPKGMVDFPHPLVGPLVSDLGDLLPALLESFALTLLDEPETSMAPYWQLEVLGLLGEVPARPDDDAVAKAFATWIRTGESLPGAPDVSLVPKTATPQERVETVLECLREYEGRYERLSLERGAGVSRAWELRQVLPTAARDVRKFVESIPMHRTEGPW